MWNRARGGNLALSVIAFVAFMIILLSALGFGVGIGELIIWLIAMFAGVALIVRRHRAHAGRQ